MTIQKIKFIFSMLVLLGILSSTKIAIANEAKPQGEPAKAENTEAPESNRFGPGKAVESFDKEEGFKISDKAANSLGVKFTPLANKGPWRVPAASIVHMKQSVAVYRRFEGWISMVLVKINSRENGFVEIQSADLEHGDEIAVSGVSFLRMTDADLNSGTVDSCAH